MSPVVDSLAIAARIRSLVGASSFAGLEDTAQRLGVPEFALRLSVDDEAPQPTLDVLAAVVHKYGVDPSWLIHGDYNIATHHAVLDAGERVTPTTLLALATPPDRVTPADAYELRVELPVSIEAGPDTQAAAGLTPDIGTKPAESLEALNAGEPSKSSAATAATTNAR